METKRQKGNQLPVYNECSFEGYDAKMLMSETAKLRKLITKRGTLRNVNTIMLLNRPSKTQTIQTIMKGFSSKTLALRLKELEKCGILERHAYNEIPPRVEYRLTSKGQELVESVINLLQWMRKWSKPKI